MITVEMKEQGETTRVLDIQVPREKVDQQFNQAIAKIRQEAVLPGFRKGKVPQDLVEKKFVAEIREAVLDELFSDSYREALVQTQCVPITQPRLEKLDLDKGKPLAYQVVVEVLPKVKLGNYKGLKLKKNKVAVTDAEVADVLEKLRQQSAVLETVEDRPAQTTDVVTIDFEGRRDNQPVAGTHAENYLLELGAGQAVPGFEDNITGLRLQETKTFPVVFPADYHAPEIAGKTVDFTATVKKIQMKKLSELNDDFAKQMGKFDTLDALKSRIKQDLAGEQERQNQILLRDQIMKELSKLAQVKVPEVLKERSLRSLFRDYEERLAKRNAPQEEPMAYEAFAAKNQEQVEFELKARLALREIAVTEKLDTTDEDLEKEIERMSYSMRQNPEVIRHWIKKNKSEDEIRDRLRDEKTQDFIIAQARVSVS